MLLTDVMRPVALRGKKEGRGQVKGEICHLDTIPRHDDASHEREGDDRRSMAMSLATLVDGHCHLGRGNPKAVSEMGILYFILGDGFRRVSIQSQDLSATSNRIRIDASRMGPLQGDDIGPRRHL